jgi:hypothetical protein
MLMKTQMNLDDWCTASESAVTKTNGDIHDPSDHLPRVHLFILGWPDILHVYQWLW